MKQVNMFGGCDNNEDSKYTKKIEAPIYEPRGVETHILTLIDIRKTNRLLKKIHESNVTNDEKDFLIKAAYRHYVFNFESIADYYSMASKEMQDLMEQSALVIIDFEKAIQNEFVVLSDDIRQQYLEEYGDEYL
jgi:hypothetical protein